MEILTLVTVLGLMLPGSANAHGDHEGHGGQGILEACKAECPKATTEEEAHTCMEGVVKKKKADRKFRKTDCYAAVQDHEKKEKDDGHKH